MTQVNMLEAKTDLTKLVKLLETKEVSEIKVIDLIRKAGVSRGAFYKYYYLVTDVLKEDIKEVSDDVGKAIGGDIGSNWETMLQTIFRLRHKISLLINAGPEIQILEQMNASIESTEEQFRLRIMVWIGIIFNCLLYWNHEGYKTPVHELALKMTEITQALDSEKIAAKYDRGRNETV